MAKLKMLKYPRKPKAHASVAVKERYLSHVKDIDRENEKRRRENLRSESLSKKIAGIGKTTKHRGHKR